MPDRNETTRLADGAGEDLQIATPEDYEVERTGDGPWHEAIKPVPQRIPGTDDHIMVRPIPPGPFAEWLPVLEGEEEDSERQAEIMRKAITEPEPFATADVDYVENGLRGGVLGGILRAIRNAAGYEVLKGNREQAIEENAAMMEHLDAEQLQQFETWGRNGAEQ